MHVLAFAPAVSAVINAQGVTASGFPMSCYYVLGFPSQITVPLVLAVYTQTGHDHDPRRYIVARSPDGERLSVLVCNWHWPDQEGEPFKFRVFAPQLTIPVAFAGVYKIGLYHSQDATETAYHFPFPVKAGAPPPQP